MNKNKKFISTFIILLIVCLIVVILPLLNKEFKGIKFKSLLLKIPEINNRIGEIINPGNNPSDIKLFNYQ